MFYNTGIATYVWVLSNKKAAERKGKVQLINGVNLFAKMRKSSGFKTQGDGGRGYYTHHPHHMAPLRSSITWRWDKPAEVKSNRGRQSENTNGNGGAGTFSSKIFQEP